MFKAARRAGQEISGRPEAATEFASLKDALIEVLIIFGFDLAEEFATYVRVESKIPGWGVLVRYEKDPGEEILEKVARRELARQRKNWATADSLRNELATEGWVVEDTSEGPILNRR